MCMVTSIGSILLLRLPPAMAVDTISDCLQTAMDLDANLDFPLPPEILRAVNPATNLTSFFCLCLETAMDLDTILDFSLPPEILRAVNPATTSTRFWISRFRPK